ncbi:hypothetical protein [Alcanivorax sp. NBRC 102024]|uniref:hypothetical protein n=1 Tax=Alcanivorax sp. NBRC 102024 TaxID=1113895 RepID=UPI000789DF73|nr:hypothetical protein [Alcanivorax sp. NBRC 102024]
MTVFASVTRLGFEIGPVDPVAVDSVADGVYETPVVFRESLGDMARLSFVTGKFRYKLVLNQPTTAGAVDVSLTDGVNVFCVESVNLDSGEVITGELEADLVAAVGASKIRVSVDVKEAADASTTCEVYGDLTVASPAVVVGGC